MPQRPVAAVSRSFPLVATAAPVVASCALWAVTQSAYALVFALLGPLIAIASLGDTAIQSRRTLRRERRRFATELAAAYATIAREHELERSRIAAAHRDARTLMAAPHRDPERWRGTLRGELPVVVGCGSRFSTLLVEGEDTSARGAEGDEWAAPLGLLREEATVLSDAPVVVDARAGIGVVGAPALAAAVARGIVLQLATALSPADHEIAASPEVGNGWLAALPHTVVETGSSLGTIVFRSRDSVSKRAGRTLAVAQPVRSALVSVAEVSASLPRECRTVLRIVGASSVEVLPLPQAAAAAAIAAEFVSVEQASAHARLLAEASELAGYGIAGGLPESVTLAELCRIGVGRTESHVEPGTARDSLACTPALGLDGPLAIDLVRDGPHAIVGGTTGSGKSELLAAWVLAMAASHGPQLVTFLLVDFKGGSSFHSVQHLPHSVGLITDLDEHSARRALASLRAELRYRERELAAAGARSIEQLPREHPLARLVIVVDEFAAMVQDFPELHELFADIAARGRSLGVHLILCTQRPSGVVRDAVLANCALRISLRVNNPADSAAVIGTAAAAELPRFPLGRALLSLGGGEAQAAQIAIAGDDDAESIALRWERDGVAAPRRPWCDPLPQRMPIDELLADARGDGQENSLVLGLVDLPQEQRREHALYDPRRDGSLIVIGGHRSGKSGALAAIAASGKASQEWRGAIVVAPDDQEGLWDAVTRQLDAVRSGSPVPALLLIDDLDAMIGSIPEEYAFALVEAVSALLREGGRAGSYLVITSRRLGSNLQPIASLCDSRLLLRLPDRQEHVAAGGDAAHFDAALAAGGGHWNGHRVQLALAPDGTIGEARMSGRNGRARPDWESSRAWIIVTRRAAELSRRLGDAEADRRAALLEGTVTLPSGWELVRPDDYHGAGLSVTTTRGKVIIADVETWQGHWSLLAALKTSIPIVFDGCDAVEFRAITGVRTLPPLIAPGSSSVWLLPPEGTVERALPPWRHERGDGNTA